MEGMPVSRAASPDGRWAYTLYSGQWRPRDEGKSHEAFIHALDTVAQRAVCIDLPQLEGRRNPLLMALDMNEHGRKLAVLDRPPSANLPAGDRQSGPRDPRILLTVNTRSFEVRKPAPVATASNGIGPWPPIAALAALAMLLLTWIGIRLRPGGEAKRTERG